MASNECPRCGEIIRSAGGCPCADIGSAEFLRRVNAPTVKDYVERAMREAAAQSWSRVGDCAARGAAAAAAVAARRPLPLRAIARKAMTKAWATQTIHGYWQASPAMFDAQPCYIVPAALWRKARAALKKAKGRTKS